jgi:hypothetical protein
MLIRRNQGVLSSPVDKQLFHQEMQAPPPPNPQGTRAKGKSPPSTNGASLVATNVRKEVAPPPVEADAHNP